MTFQEITKDEFAQFSRQYSQSFLQTRQMAEMLEKRGYQPYFVGIKQNDELKLAAFMTSLKVFGGLKFELNFGPIGQANEAELASFYKGLKAFVADHQGLELRTYPDSNYRTYDPKGEAIDQPNERAVEQLKSYGFDFVVRHIGFDEQDVVAEWQYIKDLAEISDEETLLKSYNSNAKRNVKKAIKNAVSVRVADFDELDKVEKLIEGTGEKRKFATKDLSYYQELHQAFGDKAEMLLTEVEGKAIAAGVFIEVGSEFLYLYGGSDGAYGKLGGPFLLQHTAMLHALERGLKSYNFYGISGKFDGSDGVLRFKQNFGGYITQKLGEFAYYPSKTKFKLIDILKKITGRK
ncbi:peptidoglycan bridge formation glycyltransferase FemA/FemB family protein [Lactococcus termiticola]|uniref:Peptidoglycan branched peptide synthesis protein n=1 Tax=Lactococcus termiticola TaxID=2169526 RepID=A0A2R5HJ66_9LACT|nr:peptidoglycan bridge formation glycyltransferase FemA/FemB family protein [Lactococcus termiticola]GBG96211.1 peptidoglycan branched peptide synthesis protein [Lactococcus termiticola]